MIEPPSQKEEKREKILGGIKEDPSKIFKVELIFGSSILSIIPEDHLIIKESIFELVFIPKNIVFELCENYP